MNNILRGKKLLILGATPNEIPLVKRAQELGIYVIVTDYNTDLDKSPAKKIANEYWNISWSEQETLEKKCIKEGVNGIIAGFSEIRVDNLIQLCKRLNFPCYINESQLEVTRNKILFKDECRKYNIPIIHEYETIDSVDKYPVIVKPADRAGSIGVGIAYTREELINAYSVAMEKSLTKKVIIEDYIVKGTEIDAHYVISEGKITLLCTDDIIPASNNADDGKVVQSAWMYPSKYQEDFLRTEDKKLRDMIQGLSIKNGTIFFSGFVNKDRKFLFFECGFRLWGEQEFNYNYLNGNVNYLDVYIYHALSGNTKNILKNEKKNKKLKGISLNLYVRDGIIERIDGLNKLQNQEDCFLCIIDAYIGQECSFDSAILTKAGLIGFASNDKQRLKEDIKMAYDEIRIINNKGQDMIYDRIDINCIEDWWN